MCQGCCCFAWTKWVTIMGLAFCAVELILSAVYNFHIFGFSLSVVGALCSAVYLYFILKDAREQSNLQEELVPSINGAGSKGKQRHKCHNFFWMLYVCLIIVIGLMGFIRLFALCRRTKWRDDLDGVFPATCGSWAADNGCTRIVLEKTECTRPKDIETQNSIIFNNLVSDSKFYDELEKCIQDLSGAKIMSPDDLSSKDTNTLIHVSVNSMFFGFIDDMYMVLEPYTGTGSSGISRQL